MQISQILRQLREERSSLRKNFKHQMKSINVAIRELKHIDTPNTDETPTHNFRKRRKISAAGLASIRAAQKKRWAKVHRDKARAWAR